MIFNRRLIPGCDCTEKNTPQLVVRRELQEVRAVYMCMCVRRLSHELQMQQWSRVVGFDQQPARLQAACLSSGVSRQLRAVSRGGGVERTKRTLEASCQPKRTGDGAPL